MVQSSCAPRVECEEAWLDLQGTERGSMVSVWKEPQMSGEKVVLYEICEDRTDRDLISSLSIFSPCTILGFKYLFPRKYGQEKLWHSSAPFPDIVGGLFVTKKAGLKFAYFLLC